MEGGVGRAASWDKTVLRRRYDVRNEGVQAGDKDKEEDLRACFVECDWAVAFELGRIGAFLVLVDKADE